jgi:hypothetical protein
MDCPDFAAVVIEEEEMELVPARLELQGRLDVESLVLGPTLFRTPLPEIQVAALFENQLAERVADVENQAQREEFFGLDFLEVRAAVEISSARGMSVFFSAPLR